MNARLLLSTVLLCVIPAFSQHKVDVVCGFNGVVSGQVIGDSLYLNCSDVKDQGSLVVVKNGVRRIVHADNGNVSSPIEFTVFNNTVYYVANALWKTDGISVATKVVPERVGEPTVIDNLMYFRKYDSLSGYELWKFDGENASMVADIIPGIGGSYPAHITVFNKKLYFMANHPEYGIELWTTDGTEAGTYLVKDIWPGPNGSNTSFIHLYPFNFIEYNNRFYFLANDGVHGMELWHSDGSSAGTTLLKDILPGEASAFNDDFSSAPPLFCVFNNELYFVPETSVYGKELWKTDGTASGTVMLKDINPGPGGSDITELQVSNGYLFFNANDGAHGKELWRTDGTSEGTVMVLDLQPQISGETNSNPKDFVSHIDDRLYFICMRSTEHSSCDGQENCSLLVTVSLYRTDGTEEGTEKIFDFPAGEDPDSDHMITSTEHGLYFRSINGSDNCLLWLHDDTPLNYASVLSVPLSVSSTVLVGDSASGGNLEVYSYEEQVYNYCQSNPRVRIVNTGSTPVSNFKVEYYFTVENGKTPILEKYYTGDCSVYLVSMGDSSYKIVYDYTGKTIQPGQSLPDLAGSVVGLHYPDYSPFVKTNDYSNNLSTVFVKNDHICIYSQSGSLIYGVSPYSISNLPPVAIANDLATIIDVGGDGERVVLDGSLSYDPDGTIISYEWYDGGTLIGSGATRYVTLFEGEHNFILKVTDDDGATAFDTTTVKVVDTSSGIIFEIRTNVVLRNNPVVIRYEVPTKFDGAVIHYYAQRKWDQVVGTLDGSKGYHEVKFWDWNKYYFGDSGPWSITFEVNGVITDTLYIRFAY